MSSSTVAWLLCVHIIVHSLAERAFKSGDIILGAVDVLHLKDSRDNCAELFPVGVGHAEAMIFAIAQINRDPSILPNVTLGYDIRDYCETISIAMKEAYEFVRDKDLDRRFCENSSSYYAVSNNETSSCYNDFGGVSDPVSIVIGPYDSASAVRIGTLLNVASVPIISFAATSDELSSNLYNNFMRTVPPDNIQVRVQADLFERFNWTYVGTVALDDSYGRFGASALENEAHKRKTFCIAFSEFIPRLRASETIHLIVSRIKEFSDVHVIVVWVFGVYARLFFEQVYFQKLGHRTWIFGDATSTQNSETLGPYFTLVEGALVVQPHEHRDKAFFEYLTSLTPRKTRFGQKPWWKELWRKFRNCSFDISIEKDPKCLDVPLSFKEAYNMFDPYLVYLTDAVFSAAHAFDNMFKCSDAEGLLKGGACPQTKPPMSGRDILLYLRNVSFMGKTGVVEFDEHGDPKQSSFQIVNIQIDKNGSRKKIFVGSWNSEDQQRLRLNYSAIKWKNGDSKIPVSVCSQICPPGTRKEVTVPCCWTCVECPDGTVSKEPGSTNCTDCPDKQKPNDAKTECVPLPMKNLQIWDAVGVFLTCVTAVGICATGAALGVFIKYRDTAIVKASNRQLSFALLATIAFSFSVSLLSLGKPTDLVCRVTQFSRYIIYTTFVTILWLKSVRIFVLFQMDDSDMPLQSYISRFKYQVALVALVNSVDLVLLTAWFSVDPPIRSEKILPTRYVFYACEPYRSSVGEALYFMLCSYVLLLSLLSSFYAFKVRKLPDNFNEARFIGFSLYIILLSAICYYSVEFSVQDDWYVAVISCTTTLVNSFGLLGCMFAPKMFNILFHPERNSKAAIRSQLAAYVWQNSQIPAVNSIPDQPASSGSNGNGFVIQPLHLEKR